MKIYEIVIHDEHRSPLSSNIADQFVVLAEDFDEAKKKVDKYLKGITLENLVIKSITEKYVIKQGL